ncbi:hypothetical protein, partial [Thiocapsa marina]|uniref:hypothetical protein n=1 Tax=Thiocapsa marina TaxID=244573 RepID=UPI001F1C2C0E
MKDATTTLTLTASFAVQMHTSRRLQYNIGDPHGDDLRDARPGVVEHGQQQVVALRRPGRAWV